MRLTCVTLYPTAMCNLACGYCTITKLKNLPYIDKQFEDSYKDEDYYINQLLAIGWDNIKNIRRIEFWGGEPTLALHRTYSTVRKMIELLPIDSMFFSTNLCYSNVEEEIRGLVDVCGEYPNRKFQIQIQLSIDGPEEITDAGRGNGVTKKFLDNYNSLMEKEWFSNIYDNVEIRITFKPTLSTDNLNKFIDIDYMEYYYKWFEDNLYDVAKPHVSNNLKVFMGAIPNIAVPMVASKQDGINFAKICKNAFWLSEHGNFKYYNNIVMFTRLTRHVDRNCITYCGAGRSVVELLPEGKYCACHRGFLTYLEDYRIATRRYSDFSPLEHRELETSNDTVFVFDTAQQFIDFCDRVENPKTPSSSFFVQQGMIRYLAEIGQIEEKYKNPYEAKKGANLFTEYASTCLYDNLTVCGTQMINLFSEYRMFLNGAIDIIYLATERLNVINEESRL